MCLSFFVDGCSALFRSLCTSLSCCLFVWLLYVVQCGGVRPFCISVCVSRGCALCLSRCVYVCVVVLSVCMCVVR